MKNKIAIVLMALSCFFVASCDTEPEALNLQPPYKYSEEYLQKIREYKATMFERSLCFVWFSDYSNPSSPAHRFSALPDSVDICSLWGGYPEKGTLAYEEMWQMRKERGTLLVAPTIIRIMEDKNYENFGLTYEDMVNQTTTIDPEGVYPDWCVLYGDHLLKEMYDNGIDGLDLDYEPESSEERQYGIYGERMSLFVKYLGQFIGPQGADPSKLLIVDFYGVTPPADTEPYVSLAVKQNYGSSTCSKVSGFPWEKCVYTENIGDYWTTGGNLERQAAFQPEEGYKGGFGAFYVQRDYHTTTSGSDNKIPYGHLRRAIQLQNPAVTK